MTSSKKRSARQPKGQHRGTVAAYIGAERHIIDERHAKTISQIAEETGMSTTTARYWIKRDHHEEHLRWWPNAEMLMAEAVAALMRRGGPSRSIVDELPEPDADEIAVSVELAE